MSEEIRGSRVFESTFAAFGERCTESTGDDYVRGGFGKDCFPTARNVNFGGGEMGCDLREALACWRRSALHSRKKKESER